VPPELPLDFQVKEPLLALRIPKNRLFGYFLESCTHSVRVSFLSRVKMNSLNIMAGWQIVTGYKSVLTRLSEKMSGHVLSKKDQSRQFYEKTLFNFLTTVTSSSSRKLMITDHSLRLKSFMYYFGIETGTTM